MQLEYEAAPDEETHVGDEERLTVAAEGTLVHLGCARQRNVDASRGAGRGVALDRGGVFAHRDEHLRAHDGKMNNVQTHGRTDVRS